METKLEVYKGIHAYGTLIQQVQQLDSPIPLGHPELSVSPVGSENDRLIRSERESKHSVLNNPSSPSDPTESTSAAHPRELGQCVDTQSTQTNGPEEPVSGSDSTAGLSVVLELLRTWAQHAPSFSDPSLQLPSCEALEATELALVQATDSLLTWNSAGSENDPQEDDNREERLQELKQSIEARDVCLTQFQHAAAEFRRDMALYRERVLQTPLTDPAQLTASPLEQKEGDSEGSENNSKLVKLSLGPKIEVYEILLFLASRALSESESGGRVGSENQDETVGSKASWFDSFTILQTVCIYIYIYIYLRISLYVSHLKPLHRCILMYIYEVW